MFKYELLRLTMLIQLNNECKQLGEWKDADRKPLQRIEELESEKKALNEALGTLDERWVQQNEQIRSLILQLEEKTLKRDGFQATAERLHAEVQTKEQELAGIRAICQRLQDENNKLYEHVAYSSEQLNRAKEAIDAKQVQFLCLKFKTGIGLGIVGNGAFDEGRREIATTFDEQIDPKSPF